MGWREALAMPDPIREAVLEALEDKMERRRNLEEQRFKALSNMLGG